MWLSGQHLFQANYSSNRLNAALRHVLDSFCEQCEHGLVIARAYCGQELVEHALATLRRDSESSVVITQLRT